LRPTHTGNTRLELGSVCVPMHMHMAGRGMRFCLSRSDADRDGVVQVVADMVEIKHAEAR
jgi:hypothetical protein